MLLLSVERKEDVLKYLGVDGKSVLAWIFEKLGVVGWMHLSQGRDQWWALVNTVNVRSFLTR